MAKQLESPYEIKIVINEDGTDVNVSAHYGTSCEYGSLRKTGLSIKLTPVQEQRVVDMVVAVVLPQIKAAIEI